MTNNLIRNALVAMLCILSVLGANVAAAEDPEALVVGPVESTDTASGSAKILGQSVHFHARVGELNPGAVVGVIGLRNPDGSISASSILRVGQQFVSGATPVYVKGEITATERSLGQAWVGSLRVDLTSAMHTGAAIPQIGDVVEFAGVQHSRGTLNATEYRVSGIVGGDRATHGIVGGDKALQGIVGGDRATHGIVGGDKALQGIVGGDRATHGIVGGDKALQGIVGGDRATHGIVGGDKALQGIVGGDRATHGIVGGDR